MLLSIPDRLGKSFSRIRLPLFSVIDWLATKAIRTSLCCDSPHSWMKKKEIHTFYKSICTWMYITKLTRIRTRFSDSSSPAIIHYIAHPNVQYKDCKYISRAFYYVIFMHRFETLLILEVPKFFLVWIQRYFRSNFSKFGHVLLEFYCRFVVCTFRKRIIVFFIYSLLIISLIISANRYTNIVLVVYDIVRKFFLDMEGLDLNSTNSISF